MGWHRREVGFRVILFFSIIIGALGLLYLRIRDIWRSRVR